MRIVARRAIEQVDGLAEPTDRLLGRERLECALPRTVGVRGRLARLRWCGSRDPVVRQLADVIPGVVAQLRLQQLSDASVGTAAPARRELVVQRVLEERVREREPLGPARDLGHHGGRRRLFERVEDVVLVAFCRCASRPRSKSRPMTDARVRIRYASLTEAADPLVHDLTHALRQADRREVDLRHPTPVLAADGTGLGEVAQHLGREEGVATGLTRDELRELDAVVTHLVTRDRLRAARPRRHRRDPRPRFVRCRVPGRATQAWPRVVRHRPHRYRGTSPR